MARVIDWERLLKEQRVPFIESGANVKRGEIAIRCPFCGSADPSMHMGLNLENGWWSCWRNRSQHSGKSPLRLIMKLLRVPYSQARQIAGFGDDYIDPEGFDALAAKLMHRDGTEGRPEQTRRRVLDLDPGFRVIEPNGRTRLHYEYLVDQRGFDAEGDVAKLGSQYGICAGVSGVWASRIIIPYYQDEDLVTWTGRAIAPATVRYRDLERNESILPPKETLFNHDAMLPPAVAQKRILVLVEGPFDALKLDFYGRSHGIRAVALSTNAISDAQAFLLNAAATNFQRVIVMMDNATELSVIDSMRMLGSLFFIPNITAEPVPFGAKDGAELNRKQIANWARSLQG